MSKSLKSNSRPKCISSCSQSRKYWLLVCFIIVPPWSMKARSSVVRRTSLADACLFSKEPRETITYGGPSTRLRRYGHTTSCCLFPLLTVSSSLAFLPRQLTSVPHCTNFKSRRGLLLPGSINAFLNRSQNRFPFPLPPLASSALPSSPLRLKPPLRTLVI